MTVHRSGSTTSGSTASGSTASGSIASGSMAAHGQVGEILAGVLGAVRPADGVATVLDCAGGSGSLAVPLAAEGAQVTVVDTSVNALATLARRAAEAHVGDRVAGVQGELETLGEHVPAGSFDLILLHDVFDLVDDAAALLRAVGTVARPGGAVSIRAANLTAAAFSRAGAGDTAGAMKAVAAVREHGPDTARLTAWVIGAGLVVERVSGLAAISGWVGAGRIERTRLAELDRAAAELAAFRDVAPAIHLLARRTV